MFVVYVTYRGMSTKAKLALARRRRGVSRDSLTSLEKQVSRLEEKETLLPTDQVVVGRLARKIETLDSEYKKHHLIVVELIEDDALLGEEQDTLDKHDDHVAEIADRIEQLKLSTRVDPPATGAVSAADPATQYAKRMKFVERKLATIQSEVGHLKSGPELDTCLVQQLQRRVDRLIDELSELWCLTIVPPWAWSPRSDILCCTL